jgi:hypothetical protein
LLQPRPCWPKIKSPPGDRPQRFVHSGYCEAAIASEKAMHPGRSRTHLANDRNRPLNRSIRNLRLISPQLFGCRSRRHDSDQLNESDYPAKRAQHCLIAQRAAQ